jgi:uracil-DNA glycosylase
VFDSYAEAYPWSAPRARKRWYDILLAEPAKKLVVVCLGNRAAGAVPVLTDRSWGEWVYTPGLLSFVAVPHPSGLNRLYNDPSMRALTGRVLRQALEEVAA